MESEEIQLADLLESYEPATTPGFQTLITAKEEFRELASPAVEKLPPGRGKYFKHQKFYHRYMRVYGNIIIIDETGTGKSCSVTGFTEYTRKELEKAKINPNNADEKAGHFNKVVALFKGSSQKSEFNNQLVCRCSDGHYETDLVKNAEKQRVQKTNITLEIKKAGYEVSTYIKFTKQIMKKFPNESDDERLAEEYSDTIFWVDEAHNLLIDQTKTKNLREKQLTYHTLWRVFHLARRIKVIISTATPMINQVADFGSIINLILPRDGVLPPGYNPYIATDNDIRVLFPEIPFGMEGASLEEIAPYFRGQIPSNYDFENAQLEDLEPYLRGRVGFIRAADTGAVIEEQGQISEDEFEVNGVNYISQVVVYPSRMSDFQTEGYARAYGSPDEKRDDLKGPVRQASNFIFPDGYWGSGITTEEKAQRKAEKEARKEEKKISSRKTAKEKIVTSPLAIEQFPVGGLLPIGTDVIEVTDEENPNLMKISENKFEARAFRRYVNINGDEFSPTNEFRPYLKNLETISELSCKYAEIARTVIEEPGNAFVYGEYVYGSGGVVLALCLEGLGFTRFKENSSIFVGSGANVIAPYCGNSEDISKDPGNITNRKAALSTTTRKVRSNFLSRQQGGPMRYALLSRETSPAKFHAMMEAMNSYENRHGDYIKVLISSRVGRDGINVNNVLQIHLVGPEWHQSSMYQALSRGIRATSHQDLIKEEKERIIAEEPDRDPNTAKVTVKVYKHAAIPNDSDLDVIDLQMYYLSEAKDRSIKRVMRILKQCAIGCQIHSGRNIRDTDIDGSAACDYDVCKYDCYDPAPSEIDYSTYDVLYSGDVIDQSIDLIEQIYKQNNSLTIDDLQGLLPKIRRKYLIMALDRIINNKKPLTDRFGYRCYLREDGSTFYLDRNYPGSVPANCSMAYYTQGIITINKETLSNLALKYETEEHESIIHRFENSDHDDPEFENILNSISIEGKSNILEQILLRNIRGDNSPFVTSFIQKFKSFIFQIHEPVTELNKIYEQTEQLKPRPGRKPKPETKRRVKKIKYDVLSSVPVVTDTETEIVYLHTLYTQVTNQTNYSSTSKFNKAEGRIRLLKPSEIDNGWRDLNENEFPIYNMFIQIEIASRSKKFEDVGLYGFILADGIFRIRDRLSETEKAKFDNRSVNRGRECTKWRKPKLFDIMWEIGAPEPHGIFDDYDNENHEHIIASISRRFKKKSEIIENWDIDKISWYYKWDQAMEQDPRGVSIQSLCDLIQIHMQATDRMLT